MSRLTTPAEILQRFYAAETEYIAASPDKRDIARLNVHLSSDFKLFLAPDILYGGVYEGHAGLQRWSEAMGSYFDKLAVQNPQIFERSESNSVITLATVACRVRKTGKEWTMPMVQVIKVDREKEVITEIKPFYWDVAGLNALLQEK